MVEQEMYVWSQVTKFYQQTDNIIIVLHSSASNSK